MSEARRICKWKPVAPEAFAGTPEPEHAKGLALWTFWSNHRNRNDSKSLDEGTVNSTAAGRRTEEYLMKATNHSLKFLILMLLFSTGVTLFTAGVVAQEEGWQIMRADYGFRAQRTDVTDILRDLVSRGGVNGRVAINNQTMGGDPAVGRDKSLRIFAKNRRNEEREFDVNEGGFVDARFFAVREEDRDDRVRDDRPREDRDRGDRPRDDHDRDRGDRREERDLVIIRGFYGVQGRTVNVTEQLRGMVRDGVLAVWVNNQSFGGDPAIGADKVLIVVYSSRGQEQATAVREGQRLVIP
jgi:hypothetical protein